MINFFPNLLDLNVEYRESYSDNLGLELDAPVLHYRGLVHPKLSPVFEREHQGLLPRFRPVLEREYQGKHQSLHQELLQGLLLRFRPVLEREYQGKHQRLHQGQHQGLLPRFRPVFEHEQQGLLPGFGFRPEVKAAISPNKIIIEENENSKINNIKFNLHPKYGITIKLNCLPYNILKSFDLYTDYIEIDNFPFFKSKCNIIFNCLESFHLSLIDWDVELREKKKEELIENLYKNIDKMPNLTDFYFNFNCENINENFYIKFK